MTLVCNKEFLIQFDSLVGLLSNSAILDETTLNELVEKNQSLLKNPSFIKWKGQHNQLDDVVVLGILID